MSKRIVPALVLLTFVGLLVAERSRPLRRRTQPQGPRVLRNLTVAVCSAGALYIVERPLLPRLTAYVERRRVGLLRQLDLPRGLETALAVVLLDYTLYLWHVLLHRSPLLWRAHHVHHADRDLDTATALRFHAAEMVPSVAWRAMQIVAIGVTDRNLRIWQMLTLASVAFHHSNLRLPEAFERRLVRFIVTPRMHGIHHSTVAEQTDSNWSSGLTIWDRLHGSLKLDVPQNEITIGLPGDGPLPKSGETNAVRTRCDGGSHRRTALGKDT